MSSQPTATDYLRQATYYISWALALHLKRYSSFMMAPSSSQSKERVHWTDEEISALIDYLHAHRSEAEGGSFKKQTYQGAVSHIQPLHRQGAPKDVNSVKEKFTKIKEQWRVINDYRNKSGVSWDYSRGGFWSSEPSEVVQFQQHLTSLKARHKGHLKAINHKSWAFLSKMDDIMPKSTASGQFAHDGANQEKSDDSGGESDHQPSSAIATDAGPSNPLFPPSIIAPFVALSQTGPPAPLTPSIVTSSLSMDLSSLPATPPPPSSVILRLSSSMRLPTPSAAMLLSSSSLSPMPLQALPSSSIPSSSSRSSISSRGKRKQSAVADLDDQGSIKRRGPRSTGSGGIVKVSAGESAILQGFHGSMNHFSDVVNINNETQPHTILKDATLKLNGAWGNIDRFTDGQKIVLLKLFRQNLGIASLYASTESSRIRHGYILTELQPYQDNIDVYDREEIDDHDEEETSDRNPV